jgi:hypothetical protein
MFWKGKGAVILGCTSPFKAIVAGTLTLYELPTIGQLKQHLPSKLTWKLTVKKAIQLYWTEFLLKDMQGKSTLHFMDQTTLKIGPIVFLV